MGRNKIGSTRMNRRDLIRLATVTSALAIPAKVWAQSIEAQQAGGTSSRIAFVSPASPPEAMTAKGLPHYRALLDELQRLGYVEGQNLRVDRYSGGGRTEGYSDLAREIVRSSPDLIFVPTSNLVRKFKEETITIPIVAYGSDPVAEKLVVSLARPGGNITGVATDPGLSFYEKMVELLSEVLGHPVARLGLLTSRQRWQEAAMYSAYRGLADRGGLEFVAGVLAGYEEHHYRPAFDELKRRGVDALIVGLESESFSRRSLIVTLANEYRIPAIYPDRLFVEIGGLISYGFDIAANFRRIAAIMDRILRGANPGDVPMELPTKFELAVNVKTADVLALTLPPILVSRADVVID
jgi:putative ABC transport system substrate-binding protein